MEIIMKNEKIPGLGIAHLALKANDFDKSLKFYRDGLGMIPYISWGEPGSRKQMLRFGDGAGILELFEASEEEKSLPEMGRYIHFAYSVEDVDAAYAAALEAGAKPLTAPKVVPLDSEPKKVSLNIAFVYGPDNEQIEFFKEV